MKGWLKGLIIGVIMGILLNILDFYSRNHRLTLDFFELEFILIWAIGILIVYVILDKIINSKGLNDSLKWGFSSAILIIFLLLFNILESLKELFYVLYSLFNFFTPPNSIALNGVFSLFVGGTDLIDSVVVYVVMGIISFIFGIMISYLIKYFKKKK